MSSIKNDLVDKRIVERNIEKGLLTQQDHDDYLAKLQDLEGQFELVDAGPETPNEPEAAEPPAAPPPSPLY